MAKKRFYRYPLYLLCRGLAGLVLALPESAARALSASLGRLGFAVISRQRNKTLENLRAAYGSEKAEDEIKRLGRQSFEGLALTATEILRFPRLSKEKLRERVDEGKACRVYDELLSEGKGLISITAHLGNWELLAGYFGTHGYQGAVLARKIYYEPYNRWIVELRQSLGVRTINRDGSSREVLSLLSGGGIIGLLPDQDMDRFNGIFVDYLGRPAYTSTAPAKLSLMSGAPIVTNFLVRKPDGRYKIVTGEVIRPREDLDRDAAVRAMTEKWMKSFEEVIRAYPEQWAWMHNRWRTQKRARSRTPAVQGTAAEQPPAAHSLAANGTC